MMDFEEVLQQDELFQKTHDHLLFDEDEVILLLSELFKVPGLIISVIGRTGAGKTAWAYWAAEVAMKTFGRRVATLGVDVGAFPSYDDIKQVPNGTFLVIDEAELLFHGRESQKQENRTLAKILSLKRHKRLTLVFVTQSSNMLDKLIIQHSDYFIIKEPPSLIELDRRSLQDLLFTAEVYFALLPKNMKRRVFLTYSDDIYKFLLRKYWHYTRYFPKWYVRSVCKRYAVIRGMNGLPSFWSDKISMSFADYGKEIDPRLEALAKMGEFTVKDMVRALGMPQSSAYYFLNKLKKEGKIEKVRRGVYRLAEVSIFQGRHIV